MIQLQTLVSVSDNSGGKFLKCFHIYNNRKRYKHALIGEIILGSLKRYKFKSNLGIYKGSKHRALVIRVKKNIFRPEGVYVKFSNSSVVLIGINGVPLGSRVFGPVFEELRMTGYFKIASLASRVF